MKGLKIAVLVKQVTDTRETVEAKVGADGTIDRNALPAICNPDDLNALEQALRLKDRIAGSRVVLISMGPQRAEEVLRDGIYRGADEGILLSDRRFAGADTMATSYALAMAARKIEPGLILAGRQSIDGDTAHVGPQTAQWLGWPQVTYAEQITPCEDGRLEIRRISDDEVQTVRTTLPAVVTVGGSGAAECRPCNVRRILDYKKQPVTVWTADDLGGDMARYGLSGSPTQVVDSRTIVAQHKDTEWIAADEESLSDFIARLVESHIVE